MEGSVIGSNNGHLFRQRVRHIEEGFEETEDLGPDVSGVLDLVDGVLPSPDPEQDVVVHLRRDLKKEKVIS